MKKLCSLISIIFTVFCNIGYSSMLPKGESALISGTSIKIEALEDMNINEDLHFSINPNPNAFNLFKQNTLSLVDRNSVPTITINFLDNEGNTECELLFSSVAGKNTDKVLDLTTFAEKLKEISCNTLNVDNIFVNNNTLVFEGIHNDNKCILEFAGINNCKPNISLDFMNYQCDLPRIICNNLNNFSVTCKLHHKLTNVIVESNKEKYAFDNMNQFCGCSFNTASDYYHVELGFNSLSDL